MIFKVFLIASLYVFAFGFPLQKQCGCCCLQIPQENPTTTTTTATTIAAYEPSYCDCYCCSPPVQDNSTLTTTTPAPECGCEFCCSEILQEDPIKTTTNPTTTVPTDEPSCCKCCSPSLKDHPPMTTTTAAPEPCDYSCCEKPQHNPPTTTTARKPLSGSSCCCEHQQLLRALPYDVFPLDYGLRKFKGPKVLKCPPGYQRILESCYYLEKEKMTFHRAAMNCMELGGYLFVPQSITEWYNVMGLAPRHFWTWTGLVQKGFFQDPEWNGMLESFNYSYVNWIMKPFTPLENGWSPISQCAAYYNFGGLDSLNYVYFYSCTLSFYSICETHFIN